MDKCPAVGQKMYFACLHIFCECFVLLSTKRAYLGTKKKKFCKFLLGFPWCKKATLLNSSVKSVRNFEVFCEINWHIPTFLKFCQHITNISHYGAHKKHFTSSHISNSGNPNILDCPSCLSFTICMTDGRQMVSECQVVCWHWCSLCIKMCIDTTSYIISDSTE